MGEFFGKDWSGDPFILFNAPHLTALGIILLINLLIIVFRQRFNPRGKVVLRYTLAVTLVIVEISWHLWNYAIGAWTLQTMLPFHLCSALVWLSAYMLVTKNYRIYEYSYLLGIAGAVQALLTPDAGIYGFPHFRAFQVMMSHGAIITAAITMTFVEGFRPTWASVKRVFIGANLYMIAIFILNQLIGSNYLFIAHKPETASLMDVLPPWPWYILYLEVIGLALCLLLYLPYALRDRHLRILTNHPI
jgi:hypothetical integral membrane protein (TIGR02206 family)